VCYITSLKLWKAGEAVGWAETSSTEIRIIWPYGSAAQECYISILKCWKIGKAQGKADRFPEISRIAICVVVSDWLWIEVVEAIAICWYWNC